MPFNPCPRKILNPPFQYKCLLQFRVMNQEVQKAATFILFLLQDPSLLMQSPPSFILHKPMNQLRTSMPDTLAFLALVISYIILTSTLHPPAVVFHPNSFAISNFTIFYSRLAANWEVDFTLDAKTVTTTWHWIWFMNCGRALEHQIHSHSWHWNVAFRYEVRFMGYKQEMGIILEKYSGNSGFILLEFTSCGDAWNRKGKIDS